MVWIRKHGWKIVAGSIIVIILMRSFDMSTAAIMHRARRHQQHAQYHKALALYEKLRARNTKNADVYYQMGLCYDKIEKPREAAEALTQAVTLRKTFFDAWLMLGYVQATEGWYTRALTALNEARTLRHNSYAVNMDIANVYAQLGRYENAVHTYQKVIELYPDKFLPYYHLGITEDLAGHPDESITAFKKAAELKPAFADTYTYLATLYEGKGDTEEAVYYWKKRLDNAPRHDAGAIAVRNKYYELRDRLRPDEKI